METDSREEGGKKKIIFYDSTCPMCTAITEKISKSPQNNKFDLRSIHDESLPDNVSKSEAEKEIHIVDTDGKIYRGSEAILKIFEDYPSSKFWTKVGNFPIIKQLLALGYKFVATNRHFIFGPRSRVFYLKIVIACACLAGFLLSVKLWVSTRFYPLTPVLKIFPAIPFPVDYIYFFTLLFVLVAIIIVPKPRTAIAIFATLLIILGLMDQSRWQPWAYQYLFMLIGLGLFSWRPDDVQGENNALNIGRIIVASTYVWSGIQKMNLAFITNVFPWLLGPLFKLFPPLALFGLIVPFIELGIGIGLFTKKYRNTAVWTAIAMHLSILLSIGPLGLNWNSVVWPWQIAMMLFVVLLFYETNFSFSSLLSIQNNFLFSKVVLILFLIMPLFNFFGLWDAYLSDALYSGNVTQGTLYFDNAIKNILPSAVSQYVTTSTTVTQDALNISTWSFGEMNVPPYPEKRIYQNVARYICGYADNPSEESLVVQEKPTFSNSYNSQKNYNCDGPLN